MQRILHLLAIGTSLPDGRSDLALNGTGPRIQVRGLVGDDTIQPASQRVHEARGHGSSSWSPPSANGVPPDPCCVWHTPAWPRRASDLLPSPRLGVAR